MGIILMLVIGGIIGWLASLVMRTDAQQGIVLNVVVGIVGAMVGGFLLTPLLGGAPITSGAFDVKSLLVSLTCFGEARFAKLNEGLEHERCTPAKAGVQLVGRNWTPAFAGVRFHPDGSEPRTSGD